MRRDRFLTGAARHGRSGFSLAEIMVAIAILSIGLLMAAAAFPTGLDQTRIITELSTAPLVAQEAVNLISRELGEVKETNPDWQCWQDNWDLFLPVGENVPTCRTPTFNVLFPKFGGQLNFDERDVRAYPFGTPYEKARYSWTFLMKFLEGTDIVQLLIFVQSGGEADELTKWNKNGQLVRVQVVTSTSDNVQRLEVRLADIDTITEGTVMVRPVSGELIKVAARDDDPPPDVKAGNNVYFFLEQRLGPPFQFSPWILPVDPDTGRAKVIGTYQYYLSL